MKRLFPIAALAILLLQGCATDDTAKESSSLNDPSWEWQYSDSTAMFIGIHAVNEQVVWAAGGGGRVVRTTDGGANWKSMVVPGAEDVQFRDVHAFGPNKAIVLSLPNEDLGIRPKFFKTVDGGDTWTLSYDSQLDHEFFDCFSFWNEQTGFAFSDSFEGEFTLIKTEDGGTSWTRIDPAVVPDAHPGEGAFAASGTCVQTWGDGLGWFATGASAIDSRVIRTADYGATWTEALTPIASHTTSEGISTLSVLDSQHLIAIGGDYTQRDSIYANVAVSVDGGLTWTRGASAPIGGSVYGSSYVPGASTPTIVGVAPTGTAYSTDNAASWTRIDDSDFWTVSFASVDAGWAAGRGGVARLVNGSGN